MILIHDFLVAVVEAVRLHQPPHTIFCFHTAIIQVSPDFSRDFVSAILIYQLAGRHFKLCTECIHDAIRPVFHHVSAYGKRYKMHSCVTVLKYGHRSLPKGKFQICTMDCIIEIRFQQHIL